MDVSNNKIETLLRSIVNKLNSVDAAVVMNDAYDDTYNTYGSEGNSQHPFLPVMPHASEDVHNTSQFVYYAKKFRENNVIKHFGMSLPEFLQLPRFEAEVILRECANAVKSDTKLINELEQKLNDLS